MKRKAVIVGIACGAFSALTVGYGAYVSNYPATAASGSTLSSSEWNKMVSALQTLDTGLSNFTFNANGVGIGTAPGTKFQVNGTIKSTGTGAGLHFGDRTSGNGFQWWSSGGVARLYDQSANSDRLFVAANGNVGVGTATPDRMFEVAGQIEATQPVPGGTSDGAIRIKGPTDSSYSVIQFTNNAGSAQWGMIAATPGAKIGIGTTAPTWHLEVASNVPNGYSGISNYNTAPGGIRWTWLNGSTGSPLGAGSMCFESGGACRLRVDSAGNTVAATFNGVSDSRLKTSVKTASGLGVLEKLRGVEFDWKSGDGKSSGVIAQELESVLPHLVATDSSPEKMKSVNYAGLSAYFIEGMKELKNMDDAESARVEILENENRALKEELRTLESRLSALEKSMQ